MERITIPPAAVAQPADVAAQIVIAVLRQTGADPQRMAENTMGRELCRAWARGEMGREEFCRGVANLLILNPDLAA